MAPPASLKLSLKEIEQALADRPVLTIKQLSRIIDVPKKTIHVWKAKGYLDGTFRKRGRYILFWRDKVIPAIFNGREWSA